MLNISINSRKLSKIAPIRTLVQAEAYKKASKISKVKKLSQEWMDHELKNWFL